MDADTSGKLSVNGVDLYYTQSGDGPDVLLCISGSVTPSEISYGEQFKHFGRKGSGLTIIMFDLRGYGKSKRVDRFNAETCYGTDARDAHALMEALGFTSYSVLGWCYGGGVAMVMAAMFPEAVKKLVLVGTQSFYTKEDLLNLEKSRNSSAWPPYVKELLSPFYSDELIYELWSKSLDVCREIYEKKDGDICREKLCKIACPTLVLHGGRDEMVSPSHAHYLAEHIRHSQLVVIEEGKHWMHGPYSKLLQEIHSILKTFLVT